MGTINVTVKLFASLKKGRFDEKSFTFPEGTTLSDVISSLGLPKEEVVLIFVNGRHMFPESTPSDGDTISLFPAVGGG
ncbi:MAG: MoaD/ThiS family protein [Syntrophorhabdaceae bacterium]|nr:MoaD/ThiS family protein [Syntrophorhabdaceae bacterium]